MTSCFRSGTFFSKEHTFQLADGFGHGLHRGVPKSQDKSLARSLAQVCRRKRREPKLLVGGAGRHLPIVEPFRQDHREMHTSFRSKYLERSTEFSLEFVDKGNPALGVKLAHATNVACEMTFVHEVREYGLEKVWRCYIHGMPYRRETTHQVRRNNDIAQPQRRE